MEPESARVQFIPLAPAEAFTGIEFSSLCWWGDDLLLTPQFAGEAGEGVYALSRDSLSRAIAQVRAGVPPAPLRPRPVQVEASGLPDSFEAYDGLEAVVLMDDRCFLIAEYGADSTRAWGSRLVSGRVQREDSLVTFDGIGATQLGGAQVRENYTHEALILADDELWVFAELNGASITASPQVARYSLDLDLLGFLDMPQVEYRISDVTTLDADGRFWALNLLWPPDAATVGAPEGLDPVERLVPLRAVDGRIELDRSRPVIDLRGKDRVMHNWEGVARWDARGFLLVSDTHPGNFLAFAERPD